MKKAAFFITSYHIKKKEFNIAVRKKDKIFPLGAFTKGLSLQEQEALIKTMKQACTRKDETSIYIHPSICVDIQYDDIQHEKLVNPFFLRFLYQKNWKECTYDQIRKNADLLPINITHPNKPLFPKSNVTKKEYIHYLQVIAPYILPFLKNRLLTTIRFPHGVFKEGFYQKQCPSYAPSYVETSWKEDINYILCNNEQTLLWLGNQLAFEFHIPFETIHSHSMPSEIVFDLDPPTVADFPLAVKVAKIMRQLFNQLHLIAFVKISGNKGIQVYLPLPEQTYTYDDIRLFTTFIANYLVQINPDFITIERLKKHRKQRLYIDYIQHGEGKTIIAPYSIRGNEGGYVACPLYWHELDSPLHPATFTMGHVQTRLKNELNPFIDYFQSKEIQPFDDVLAFIKSKYS